MPRRVTDLLVHWAGLCVQKEKSKIWEAILSCLMWPVWREMDFCISKDKECLVLQLKSHKVGNLFEWEQSTSSTFDSDLLYFLDSLYLG